MRYPSGVVRSVGGQDGRGRRERGPSGRHSIEEEITELLGRRKPRSRPTRRRRRPEAGDPIQYDDLRIEHDQGVVEIVVYNRAILLFMTETEAVKRIHQVCCRLDDIAGSRRPA